MRKIPIKLMGQKHVFIIFIILAILGVGAASMTSVKENLDKSEAPILPTKTPENLIFNQNALSAKQNQNEEYVKDSPQLQPQQKQAKSYDQFPGILSPQELKNKKAVIETPKGVIEFEIYPEASKAASNFIQLSRDGFYDGLTFHRVEPGFVIQGGDPLGNGTGGPGYKFADEPVTQKYDRGIVAMANSGPNTNGSQFFIMLADTPSLPPKYTIFGKVLSGIDVVDQIKVGDVMKKVQVTDLVKAESQK